MYTHHSPASVLGLLLAILISAWAPAVGIESVSHSSVTTTWQVIHAAFHKYGISPYPEFVPGQSAAPVPQPAPAAATVSAQPHAAAQAPQLQAAVLPDSMQCDPQGVCTDSTASRPRDHSGSADAAATTDLAQDTVQLHPASTHPAAPAPAPFDVDSITGQLQHTQPLAVLSPAAHQSSGTQAAAPAGPPPAAVAAAPAAAAPPTKLHRSPPVRRLLNLAELSDGASVVAANLEARRPERAIDRDIDSFMKNDCDAEKWMIIELSQLGTVETVKLTMKELYSSRVHTFRVFGRSSHPRKDGPDLTAGLASGSWQLLGSFTAENKRGTQSFSLPQRSRVRYLLLMFDTHYGNEQMCAMNWIEVLGVSAAQELEEALALQEMEAEHEEQQQQHVHDSQLQQQHARHAHTQQQHQHPQALPEHGQQKQQQPLQGSSQDAIGEQHKYLEQPPTSEGAAHHAYAGGNGQHAAAQHSGGHPGADGAAVSSAVEANPSSSQPQQPAVAGGHQQQQQQQQQPTQGHAEPVSTSHPQGRHQDVPQATAGVQRDHSGEPSVQQDRPAGLNTAEVAAAANRQSVQQPGDGTTASPAAAAASAQQQRLQQAEGPTGVTSNGQSGATGPADEAAAAVAAAAAVNSAGSGEGQAAAPGGNGPTAAPVRVEPPGRQVEQAVQHGMLQPGKDVPQQPSSVLTGPADTQAASAAAPSKSAQQQQMRGDVVPTDAAVPTAVSISSEAFPAAAGAAGAGATAGSSMPAGAQTGQEQQQQQVHQGPTGSSNGKQQQQQQVQSGPSGSSTGGQRDTGSVLDSRGSNKPKQAGNLFDVVKSEMMQLKLDQSKLTKRVDGLSKRSTDFEATAAALQQQQAALSVQMERLSKRLDALAASHATAAAAQQQLRKDVSALLAAQKEQGRRYAGPRPEGPTSGPGARYSTRGPETVLMQESHVPASPGSSLDRPGQPLLPPMCARPPAEEPPLLLQSKYQWSVVTALASTSLLGLWLVLHPKSLAFPQMLRLVVCVLALLNGILAVLLGLWLLVMQGLAAQQQQQQAALLMTDPRLSVPMYRMLSNGSTWSESPL